MNLRRMKNRLIAVAASRLPDLAQGLSARYAPVETIDIPWVKNLKPLDQCRVAMVTTAGLHHSHQTPFDMTDPDGDPTFRRIESPTIIQDYLITHDYYNHKDAERDINVVFPIQRLMDINRAGVIKGVADSHYSVMGHIDGRHIRTLVEDTAPQIARHLVSDRADIVLLTPG
ncbi:MAG: hypothetical protein HKM93_18130 [Desulfobacteraceae bacterium]|nr:hypothetical protein [Desulfobacteraceae bacterium]